MSSPPRPATIHPHATSIAYRPATVNEQYSRDAIIPPAQASVPRSLNKHALTQTNLRSLDLYYNQTAACTLSSGHPYRPEDLAHIHNDTALERLLSNHHRQWYLAKLDSESKQQEDYCTPYSYAARSLDRFDAVMEVIENFEKVFYLQ